MRWEELSWDKVRRAQMRWRVQCEVWGKKSAVWSVECEVWSVDCEVWRLECEECSVKCGLWSAQCEVWSVECEEGSVKCEECGVWSAKSAVWRVQCEVCSVECEDCQVWSVKWSFKCDMWNKTPVSQSARTHGLGWRTAHASSIDEKGLIYIFKIFKATSAPPRAGTTGNTFKLHIFQKFEVSVVNSFSVPFSSQSFHYSLPLIHEKSSVRLCIDWNLQFRLKFIFVLASFGVWPVAECTSLLL